MVSAEHSSFETLDSLGICIYIHTSTYSVAYKAASKVLPASSRLLEAPWTPVQDPAPLQLKLKSWNTDVK